MDMEIDDEENVSQVINDRLGLCEVCAVNLAKYTCPGCELKTCCLTCVNIHKSELKTCTGKRNKAKFIPLKKFTDIDLVNDYRFLEEVNRTVETLSKEKNVHTNRYLPKPLYKLQIAAAKRKITVKFLPNTFSKRRSNKSYVKYKTDEIFWHVKWIFTNANDLTFTESVLETTTLSDVLDKYLTVPQENEILQNQLQYYQSKSLTQLKFLLQADEKPKNKYYELDISKNLKDILQNKIIIEHPIIYVIFHENVYASQIIDSDDESECSKDCEDSILNYNLSSSSDESD